MTNQRFRGSINQIALINHAEGHNNIFFKFLEPGIAERAGEDVDFVVHGVSSTKCLPYPDDGFPEGGNMLGFFSS